MLIALPNFPVLFQKIAWTPIIPQQKNRSAWTGRSKTIGLPGAEQWAATAYALAPANQAEQQAWDAFLASCRGSENYFHLPALPLRQTRAPNPNVTGAVEGNRSVILSSVADVAIGMYATVTQADGHARLVKVTAIVGLQVGFEPTLSAAPAAAPFVIDRPYARMQLPEGSQPLTVLGEPFQFDAEEKL